MTKEKKMKLNLLTRVLLIRWNLSKKFYPSGEGYISKFYKGKSKSFMSLNNIESLSMKDLGRPDNLYSRHRRNILRQQLCSRGGISKKPLKAHFTVVSSCGDDSSSASRSFETSALTD
ncbi:Uncharacterized protein Rs2_43440 [Raphanus sativus]|nr:Uncharacterized protein Rs2_43440 [Raphanus sativus]